MIGIFQFPMDALRKQSIGKTDFMKRVSYRKLQLAGKVTDETNYLTNKILQSDDNKSSRTKGNFGKVSLK